jgi:hypothetical protein
MTEHEWRQKSAEGTRHYCATRFARAWKIRSRLKGEIEWTPLDPPYDPMILRTLRDVLWAKYQRRKLPFEVVHEVDQLLPAEHRRTTEEKGGGLVRKE